MVKEFTYRGKNLEELQNLSLKEFVELLPTRQRRSILKGFTSAQKILLEKIEKARKGLYKKTIKTQVRDMIVLPNMVGLILHIHKGKEFVPVKILPEMIGLYLGELVLTRQKVAHSAPGIGATKSSTAISVK